MAGSLETEKLLKIEGNNLLSLVFIKPGYSRPEIIEVVEEGFRSMNINIITRGSFRFTREQANEFYSHHKDKTFFNTHSGYISSGSVTYFIVSGSSQENQKDFYIKVRGLTKDIRSKFGRKKEGAVQRKGANPIHSSTSFEEAKRELEILGLK